MGLDQFIQKKKTIQSEAAYWRKAYAIHDWFSNQTENGLDNCEPMRVTKEMLEELLDVCKEVKENHDLAEDLLPSSYGYGSWYWEDINSTIAQISYLLRTTNFDTEELWYHGWW